MRIFPILAAAVLILSLSACKKNIQTNEAVRDAVVKHLAKRTDLAISGMNIEVANVTFSENKAQAMVSFVPKNGPAEAGMKMQYTLEQKSGVWEVVGKADSGMGSHGGGMGGAMSGAPAGERPPAELPPNHPPMGAPAK